MTSIALRFFRELFDPGLKCRRVGHRMRVSTKSVLRRDVADLHVVREHLCRRCGYVTEELLGVYPPNTRRSGTTEHN